MSKNNGLTASYLLDGKGGGKPVQWDEINAWQPSQGVLWVHLDYAQERSRN